MIWETVQLAEFVTLKRGYDLPSSRRIDGSVPVVSSSGVTGRHNTAKVKGPGVITGRYGTLGEVFFVSDDFWPLNTSLYFSLLLLSSDEFVALASKTMREGSKMPRADWKHLLGLKFRIPSPAILDMFNAVVTPICSQLRSLALRNRQLAQARDLLLPRLMNGEMTA